MTFDIRVVNSIERGWRASLSGRLDEAGCAALSRFMARVYAARLQTLVFDMSQLHHIGVSGLSAVLAIRRTLASTGATFVLVNARPPVRKIFDVLRDYPICDLFESVLEAEMYLDTYQGSLGVGAQRVDAG